MDNIDPNWSALADTDEGQVVMACFDEQNGENYRGLLIRGEGNALQVILGNNPTFMLPLLHGDSATLAITKDNEQYSIYLNGEKLYENEQLPCDAYSGTLLLGCEELAPGGRSSASRPRAC